MPEKPFERPEVSAATVDKSAAMIRTLVAAGIVPAVRENGRLLVDGDAVRAHYRRRPVVPHAPPRPLRP
jgi:hypothetical protein